MSILENPEDKRHNCKYCPLTCTVVAMNKTIFNRCLGSRCAWYANGQCIFQALADTLLGVITEKS